MTRVALLDVALLTGAGSVWPAGVSDVGQNARTHHVVGASVLTVDGAGQAGRVGMQGFIRALSTCCKVRSTTTQHVNKQQNT